MPTSKDVLTAFRDHLVAQALVRKASSATPSARYPMLVQKFVPSPKDTAPEGTTGHADLMVGIFGRSRPAMDGEGNLLGTVVTVRYRAAPDKAGLVFELDAAIRAQLTDPIYGYKDAWHMAGVFVHRSRQVDGASEIADDPEQGSEWVARYDVEVHV